MPQLHIMLYIIYLPHAHVLQPSFAYIQYEQSTKKTKNGVGAHACAGNNKSAKLCLDREVIKGVFN